MESCQSCLLPRRMGDSIIYGERERGLRSGRGGSDDNMLMLSLSAFGGFGLNIPRKLTDERSGRPNRKTER